MKLDELALLMGKTREELEEILNQNIIIELKLTERANKETKDYGTIEILK